MLDTQDTLQDTHNIIWQIFLHYAKIKISVLIKKDWRNFTGGEDMYIFVSHSSTDFKIAEKVYKLIEANGHQCFYAPRDIRIGHEYAEEIIEGIERADAVLLLLSQEANNSQHVLREIERAVSKHITIIVYKLEEVELSKSMEYFLMAHQWINTKPKVDLQEIVECINNLSIKEKRQGSNIETKVAKGNVKSNSKRKFIISLTGIFFVLAVCISICINLFFNKRDVITVSLGDTIILGSYNGEPIEWRVLKLSEDGTEAVVVSNDILTMKAYDAAESGKYNFYEGKDYWAEDIKREDEELQHLLRGNNQWSTSNIRTWLNASTENVKYEDQAPRAVAMSELTNGYDTEPGFLSNFSDEEREAILVTSVVTNGKSGRSVTEDRVFLLSSEELEWFVTADISLMSKPTKAALEQDKSEWYEINVQESGVEDYYWWLRDADISSEYEAYIVRNSYNKEQIGSESVGLEGFGIRPAMTVDLTSDCIVVK